MQPHLAAIQEFVQQAVEAVATALGAEVMVFDPERNIVAGTGVTKGEIGNRYTENSLTGHILVTGKPVITRDPGRSHECNNCFRFGTCPYYLVIGYPIMVGKSVIGSFCLVATDLEQQQRILANEENTLQFLGWMSKMVGSAINERQVQDELSLLLKQYDNVVNSVNEGIIAVDELGFLNSLNRSAAGQLGVDPSDVKGMHISGLLPGLPQIDEVMAGRKKVETEVSYLGKRHQKKRSFLATIMPVVSEDGMRVRGCTISLRNLLEIQSYAAKLVGGYTKYTFDDIQGESEGIHLVKHKLQKAARTDSTILIRGESGTGKELFAHAVHAASFRANGPFIAINCSAIPESLLETELFGYEEGAFTGAKKGGKPGKFELASGGTLFLDEIGDMPLHLQSKLLRVLENHSIERVGGIDPVKVNTRIIAATNRNLEDMVERREFRGDLYYRLNVIPVLIPALWERREDVIILINYFLAKYSVIMDRPQQELAEPALTILKEYPWPGNVRELQNAIEYAINMSESGHQILPEHLPHRILTCNAREKVLQQDENIKDLYETKLKTVQIELIQKALERFGTSTEGKEQAARHLGISLATLYRKLKEIAP